ncbi:molybdopterin-dependent oxidoreductase [Salinactinospora qingdaonensis]|uniref:Sulfite oxidase n=1 Tax=Salinactinospora qingdaonensis TaxID=702744 RepID=A0ABP7EZ39_9ACTN
MTITKRSPGRLIDALSGLLAAGSALATAELAAAWINPQAAPLIAVGGAVIDAVPRPLKELAVSVFGTADKPLLLGGMAVVLAAFAAGIGVLARRNWTVGWLGIAALSLLGAAAALARPDSALLDALPAALGGFVAMGVLQALLAVSRPRLAPTPDAPVAATSEEAEASEPATSELPQQPSAAETFNRRGFVALASTAAALSAAGGVTGRWLAASSGGTAASQAAVRLPRPASPAAAVPDGADLEIAGLAPFFSANEDFYRIDTALATPRIDATTWRLRIHGRGVNERTYTYADLLAREDIVERDVTLACVSNPVGGDYVDNARWIGIPLEALLREAGIRPPREGGPADQLVSRSSDGMTIGTPVDDVMDGRDAMLALGMNGKPLPVEHGFPVRMVVPGLYGYVSACKWLVEMELTTFDAFDAYWVPRGWAAQAPIKTQSRIDTPRQGDSVSLDSGTTVPIAGVAWAQNVGIDRVEVSVDGGPWQQARLAAEDTADTWRQWVFDWPAEPGSHELRVRATDRSGQTQTADTAPPAPDGATGYHTVNVTVT